LEETVALHISTSIMKTVFCVYWCVIALVASVLLSSCVIDPLYTQNAPKLADVDYPPNKVVGEWVKVWVSGIQTSADVEEAKTYYTFFPGGKGHVRQFRFNRLDDSEISIEAAFRWEYIGPNRWMVFTPASSEYRQTDGQGLKMYRWGPQKRVIRFYNGHFYDISTKSLLVKATRKDISAAAERLRSQPVPLWMDVGNR
jgi:hypothetical protein